MSQQVWRPVDTHTEIYGTPNGTIVVSISGNRIAFDFHGASAKSLEWTLEDNHRLCTLTTVPDAPSVRVPVEAIGKLLHSYYIRYGPNETYRAVSAWVEILERTKEGE